MKGQIVKLIYQTFLPDQGRYPRVSGQAKILLRGGFDVTVLACDREARHRTREVVEGVKVERIPVKTGEMRGPFLQLLPLALFWLKTVRWVFSHSFDVLHCHNLDVLFVGWLVKQRKSCPVVFDAHEPNYYALWPRKWGPFLKLIDMFETFFARRVDIVTVTNEYQVNKYKKLGVKRVELVGNYPLPHLRTDELLEEKFDRQALTFGRLGTIYDHAGFEETLIAFQRVQRDYPNTRLLIGGRIVKKYEKMFRSLIAPVEDHVEYIGPYSAEKMSRIYKRIDVSILIYPKSEWFRNITPRKFFDSVANGVPVIITDIGGLGEVVKRNKCGLLVEEKDIDTITQAMIKTLENGNARKRMASNALKLAQTEYNWKSMAAKYVDIQEALISRAKSR